MDHGAPFLPWSISQFFFDRLKIVGCYRGQLVRCYRGQLVRCYRGPLVRCYSRPPVRPIRPVRNLSGYVVCGNFSRINQKAASKLKGIKVESRMLLIKSGNYRVMIIWRGKIGKQERFAVWAGWELIDVEPARPSGQGRTRDQLAPRRVLVQLKPRSLSAHFFTQFPMKTHKRLHHHIGHRNDQILIDNFSMTKSGALSEKNVEPELAFSWEIPISR